MFQQGVDAVTAYRSDLEKLLLERFFEALREDHDDYSRVNENRNYEIMKVREHETSFERPVAENHPTNFLSGIFDATPKVLWFILPPVCPVASVGRIHDGRGPHVSHTHTHIRVSCIPNRSRRALHLNMVVMKDDLQY